jgi:hypothetical protein
MNLDDLVLCGSGFQCLSGAKNSQPTTSASERGAFCPAGSYCSSNLVGPQPCPLGYYNPDDGAVNCIYCPAGRYCDDGTGAAAPGLTTTFICEIGYYCPAMTVSTSSYTRLDCPAGTYGGI